MQRDFLETLRDGAVGPLPSESRFGLVLWRASVYVVPLLSLLMAFTMGEMARDARSAAEDLMNPWAILFTFGLILVLAAFMSLFAAWASMMATLGLVLAPVLGVALAWSLGRYLEERRGLGVLAAVGFGGLPAAMGLSFSVVPLSLLAFLPLVAFFAVLATRPRRSEARQVPVQAPVLACPRCQAQAAPGASFCGACGTPLLQRNQR